MPKYPVFFVNSPYAEKVIGFVRSIPSFPPAPAPPPRPPPPPAPVGLIGATRRRTSCFAPAPFVTLTGVPPASGSDQRSYRSYKRADLPSALKPATPYTGFS